MTTHTIVKRKRFDLAKKLRDVQTWRLVSQAGFALFILYTAVVHLGTEGTDIITASPEAFCPLGGFESLYRFVTSGGKTVQHTHLSNMVLFVALLVMTVTLRGAFCGWVCPFGAIQEWLHRFSGWLQKKVPALRKGVKWLKTRAGVQPAYLRLHTSTRPTFIQQVDRYLRLLKYGVLAWLVWGTITFGYMVFRDVDPWSALLTIAEGGALGGLIVLGVTVVASFFVDRPWCRYACPLGAVIGLVSQVSPVRLQREGAACTGCAVCDKACPMGLQVATATDVTSPNCIMCLKCVESCPQSGSLAVKLVLPGVPARPSQADVAVGPAK